MRKRSGLTQSQLAMQLTDRTGEQVSMCMVSNWERGLVDVPASVIPDICHIIHCTSYELYPHSETLTDRDVQLISTLKAMSDEEKDDLIYLLHEWDGDRLATNQKVVGSNPAGLTIETPVNTGVSSFLCRFFNDENSAFLRKKYRFACAVVCKTVCKKGGPKPAPICCAHRVRRLSMARRYASASAGSLAWSAMRSRRRIISWRSPSRGYIPRWSP